MILASLPFLATGTAQAAAARPPSQPGVDAPELAALGPMSVGLRTITLVQPAQADLSDLDPATQTPRLHDRKLLVDIWYPASVFGHAPPVIYKDAFRGEPPLPPTAFTVQGLAHRNAKPLGGGYPLVVVSHGYSNAPASMTWLSENLASKGYVVAAIHHQDPDPDRTSPIMRAIPTLRRPIDIGFATRTLQGQLGAQIDPTRVGLVGYSMGGYGVVTAGGAGLDPAGPMMALIPGGAFKPYAKGASRSGELKIAGLKAVVAMAPAGGGALGAWNADGLADITAPLLLISGDQDPVVDYTTGAKAIFAGAVHSDRYLLTYREAGHAVGLNPAPPEMTGRLWDLDWFNDPVWRPDRINAINLHFITAFLDLNLRNRTDRTAYLDVKDVVSDDGVWPYDPKTPYSALSPASGNITVWKGFQRRHVRGLEFRHASAVP